MILVSGANGNLARAVIDNLIASLGDLSGLAVGSRDIGTDYVRQLASRGISVRKLDFHEPGSVVKALAGIDRVLFISTYEPNDVRIKQHRNAVDAAVQAGVSHVVYTSFINAVPESAFEHNRQVHAPTERMILDSGLHYTILRHNLYTEFLVGDLAQTLKSGRLKRGGGRGRISFIGRDDLGVSAARILTEAGHRDRIYTETGPEAITYEEAAVILSAVFGQPVRYEDLSPEQWFQHSLGMGFPESLARASSTNVRAVLDGEFSTLSDDYAHITGHPARGVRQYLTDNRKKFLPTGA